MVFSSKVKKESYDVIVIGSGISGLVCAAELISKGKSVLVLEQHSIPGGAMTMFKRGDFWFEAGGHRITGIRNSGGVYYDLLKKINKPVKCTPINPSYVVKIGDKILKADRNLDTYKKNILALFPEEEDAINKFLNDMVIIAESLKYLACGNVTIFTMLTKHKMFLKSANKTTRQFMNGYTSNEELIIFLTAVGNFTTLTISEQSFIAFANIWSGHHLGEGMSQIDGGTKTLVNALVDYINSNNGQVITNSKVEKILIKNKAAVGIQTIQGTTIKAQVVVSCASNEETYFNLIGKDQLKQSLLKKIRKQVHSLSVFQIYLGIDSKDFKGLEAVTTFILDKDANRTIDKIYNWDVDALSGGGVVTLECEENSPPNKRIINISCLCPYEHPENWYLQDNDKSKYNEFKQKLADKIIENMSKHIPGLEKRVIVKSIATPLTIHRYTMATNGAIQGLAPIVSQSGIKRGRMQTPIKNLYQTGQYVFPGAGILPSGISGKKCADLIYNKYFSR